MTKKYRIYSKHGRFYAQYKWGPFWIHFGRWEFPESFSSKEEAKEHIEFNHNLLVFKKKNPKTIIEEFELPL